MPCMLLQGISKHVTGCLLTLEWHGCQGVGLEIRAPCLCQRRELRQHVTATEDLQQRSRKHSKDL